MSLLSKQDRAPVLCYVTDRHLLPGVGSEDAREVLLRKIEDAAAAGVDWIQLREKDLSGKDCSWLTRAALQRASRSAAAETIPPRIIVNDRLDVALADGAGGVHLSENGLPIPEVKRLIKSRRAPGNFLVGKSCHSLEAAKLAEGFGADYIVFGPVFATPSKDAYGAPQGFKSLTEVCRRVSVPVIAIGGITLENFAGLLSAGASGIAAIRLFQDTADISKLVQALRKTVR